MDGWHGWQVFAATYLDFSKAYDISWHNNILNKCYQDLVIQTLLDNPIIGINGSLSKLNDALTRSP